MRRFFIYIILFLSPLLALLVSCSEEVSPLDGNMTVSALDTNIETKANHHFATGTSYWFYAFAVDEASGLADFSFPALMDDMGTEADDGHIAFEDGTLSTFGGRTMSFYALTFADSDASHWDSGFIESSGQSPKYSLSRNPSDGRLEDLRHGILENMSSSSSSGHLDVQFRHALSKLRFVAARQNVANLDGIYIKSITLSDYADATLDLESGDWAVDGEEGEVMVYSYTPDGGADYPDEDRKLTTSSSFIADALVFPRNLNGDSANGLRLTVRTHNPTVSANDQTNYSQDLSVDFTIPQDLCCNSEYTLSITITNKGVRIIILEPQEADWIETTPGDEMDLGQPVTFGGVTWADRNLGATFAPDGNKFSNIRDVKDWDNMRGYFYQFGRNVPYFVLKNRKMGSNTTLYSDFANNHYTYCESGKNNTNAPYALLDGESLNEAFEAATPKKTSWAAVTSGGKMPLSYIPQTYRLDLKKEPKVNYVDISDFKRDVADDANRFAIVSGAASDYEPWWVISSSDRYAGTPDTWDSAATQPCPKGWRIPTKEDWAYIMPLCKRTGDITFNPGGSKKEGTYSYRDRNGIYHCDDGFTYGDLNSEFNNHYHHLQMNEAKDSVWWAETGGDRYDVRIDNVTSDGLAESLGDPSVGDTTQYLCVAPVNAKSRGTLYAIKCTGTDKAYRLRWEFKRSEGDDVKWPAVGYKGDKPLTLVISRFPAQADDRLRNLEDLNSLDWRHPSEIMEFPVGGYIFTEGQPVLVNAGNETVYACSTVDPLDGWYYAVRLKYNEATSGGSIASRYLMLIKMRRAYGMCIRPVRDNSVVIK